MEEITNTYVQQIQLTNKKIQTVIYIMQRTIIKRKFSKVYKRFFFLIQ